MPIKDIIGGASAASGASVDSEVESSDSGALSGASEAGDIFESWLNSHTPTGINWQLNFEFIGAILSGLSTIVTLTDWVT